MATLTPDAIVFFEALHQNTRKSFCNVSLKKVGCSGYQYLMEWSDEPIGELVAYPNWFLGIDPAWRHIITALTIDITTDALGQRKVVYRNPLTHGWCGCGESFMVQDAT